MPSGTSAQVVEIKDVKGQNIRIAAPGENVTIALKVANSDAV